MPPAGSGGLRIAFLVDSFPALSETFVLNQITGLLDLGHEVDIYATWAGPDRRVHPDIAAYRLLARAAYPEPGAHPRLEALRALLGRGPRGTRGLGPLLGALGGRLDAPRLRLLPVCLRRSGERAYHIAQCHYAANGVLGVVLKELGGSDCKVVTMFHRYDLREIELAPGRYAHLRRQGDCFLAISRHTRARLERAGFPAERIVDHPVGVDLSKLPFRGARLPPSESVEILTVARLVPQKGLQHGIRAVHRLLVERPALRLRHTILGGGPLEAELRGLVGSLGLEQVIRFRGEAEQGEVAEAMQRADIFLLPSVDEILPVALMEAQAVGLPVVATDVGAVAELVEDGSSGFVVPPEDPAALAAALGRLLDEPRARSGMGEAGRRRVAERYDIGVLNRRLVGIYERLLAQGAPG